MALPTELSRPTLTLHTAAAVTAWPLLDSPRNGQAALFLFQKHILLAAHLLVEVAANVFDTDGKYGSGACTVLTL